MMKTTTLKITQWIQILILSLLTNLAVAQTSATIDAAQPEALIKTLSQDLLAQIRTDKDIQAGNTKRIQVLVDEKILPYVNFQRMTSSAVGKYWSKATPEQQKSLSTEFRNLLVHTYSGALATVKDQTIQIRGTRGNAATDNEVVVRSLISQPRGEPIQLDYRLEKAGSQWKVYDMNVAGIWLVETYRNSFSQEISQTGIDGLISALNAKNKAIAAGPERAKKSS
jgi:phospholipid transport system substrate-binding protein